ncbi:MAG: hypothetical protein AABX69_00020 [Nanoarchaeota archaeon]
MKDQRFLPADKREPVDDYEDYAEESSDELSVGGEAEATESGELEPIYPNGKKVSKDVLYIAS